MPILVECSECGSRFRAKDSLAEKEVPCPKCQKPLVVEGLRVPEFDVFLSHSSKDADAANAVCHVLEEKRIRCWIAPRDIPAGKKWAAAIVDGLSESRVMLLLLSEDAVISQQVMNEIEQAVQQNLAILPVRLEEVQPTPEMSYFISRSHWLDAFPPPFDEYLERITKNVRALLSSDDSSESKVSMSNSRMRKVKEKQTARRGFGFFPILLLAGIIGALYLSWRLFGEPSAGEMLAMLQSNDTSRSAPSKKDSEAKSDPNAEPEKKFPDADRKETSPQPNEPDEKAPPEETETEPDEGTPETGNRKENLVGPDSKPPVPPKPPEKGDDSFPVEKLPTQFLSVDFSDVANGQLPEGWKGDDSVFVRSGVLSTIPKQKKPQTTESGAFSLAGDFVLRLNHLVNGDGELHLRLRAANGEDVRITLFRAKVSVNNGTPQKIGSGGDRREVVLSREGDTFTLSMSGAEPVVFKDLKGSLFNALLFGFVTGGVAPGKAEVHNFSIVTPAKQSDPKMTTKTEKPHPPVPTIPTALLSEHGGIDFSEGKPGLKPPGWEGDSLIQIRRGTGAPALIIANEMIEDPVSISQEIKLGGEFFLEMQFWGDTKHQFLLALESSTEKEPLEFLIELTPGKGWMLYHKDREAELKSWNGKYNYATWVRIEHTKADGIVVIPDGNRRKATQIAPAQLTQYDRLAVSFLKGGNKREIQNLRWGPLKPTGVMKSVAFNPSNTKLTAEGIPEGWIRLSGSTSPMPQRLAARDLTIGNPATIDLALEVRKHCRLTLNLIGKSGAMTIPILIDFQNVLTVVVTDVERTFQYNYGPVEIQLRREGDHAFLQFSTIPDVIGIDATGWGEFEAIELDLIYGVEDVAPIRWPSVKSE